MLWLDRAVVFSLCWCGALAHSAPGRPSRSDASRGACCGQCPVSRAPAYPVFWSPASDYQSGSAQRTSSKVWRTVIENRPMCNSSASATPTAQLSWRRPVGLEAFSTSELVAQMQAGGLRRLLFIGDSWLGQQVAFLLDRFEEDGLQPMGASVSSRGYKNGRGCHVSQRWHWDFASFEVCLRGGNAG